MKTLAYSLLIIVAVFLSSCEGPIGPPGEDGTSLLGSVFEIEGDFTQANNLELFFDFPNNFEIYDTDVVLVYILWETTKINGKDVDVWRLLPQTRIFTGGFLQYNFDYTINDVKIFLETNLPYNQLLPGETQDQIFRIVVLPADFVAQKKSVEISDMNFLLNSPDLKLNIIHKK